MKRRHLSEMRFILTELMVRAGSVSWVGWTTLYTSRLRHHLQQSTILSYTEVICSKYKIGCSLYHLYDWATSYIPIDVHKNVDVNISFASSARTSHVHSSTVLYTRYALWLWLKSCEWKTTATSYNAAPKPRIISNISPEHSSYTSSPIVVMYRWIITLVSNSRAVLFIYEVTV